MVVFLETLLFLGSGNEQGPAAAGALGRGRGLTHGGSSLDRLSVLRLWLMLQGLLSTPWAGGCSGQ